MKLDAMALFVQVAASGSFTAAALASGLPKSTVSQRVAELEAALGVRLLHRTTRRLSLTAAGQVYLAHCETMLDAAHAADAAISRLRDEPAGNLRLTAPEASGILLLPPLLAAFHARHPAVTVECVITDAHLDLVAERIDLALRTGQLGDSSFVSRRVGTVRRVLVAAPRYLERHGAPLRANNLNILRGLAVAGAGIALLPWFLVRDALENGSVALVLPEHPPTDNSYYAVYPGRSHRPAALSALLDFIDQFGLASYLS